MNAENSQESEVWQRLEQGRQTKAAQGGYVGYGSPAFGQRSLDGNLVENPDEQQVIDMIRRHHKSGKSLQQVADWLNQRGYKTKRGQQWQRISVKRVLDRLYGRTPRLSHLSNSSDLQSAEETPAQSFGNSSVGDP
ncbi:MAG: recombinase family protein [Oscillatoriophycideae cyanobacterium NC_groundwater_1537_Pr4_S-0.65um_50_18]|nr:recombinase family protein [Oscillatoriophycideae cyanobacterium NC_groundwater_1537_Pr4_S-0.65um_50_18]